VVILIKIMFLHSVTFTLDMYAFSGASYRMTKLHPRQNALVGSLQLDVVSWPLPHEAHCQPCCIGCDE